MKNQIWHTTFVALIGATLVFNNPSVGVTRALEVPAAPHAPALAANKILLVTNNTAASPFGDYLGEILRVEGLNSFDVVALSALTATDLTTHAVTILAETALSAPQAALLNTFVNEGGRLLAMRPDSQIKELFNLGTATGVLSDGYVRFSPNAVADGFAAGIGLPTESLQIHGPTDEYLITNPAQAMAVATLYGNRDTATSYPAIVLSNAGSGKAAAFLYDLGRNVAYTRQGNPDNADKNIDNNYWNAPDGSYPVISVSDLFQSADTSATLWIDRERMNIPQADVQQRLFARLVRYLASSQTPLPQLWYFPAGAKSLVVLTGDSGSAAPPIFQDMAESAEKYGGAFTFFMHIYSDGSMPLTYTQQLVARGHEFGPLIRDYFDDPLTPELDITTLEQGFTKIGQWFKNPAVYGALTPTVAIHSYSDAWKGWTGGAELAAANGFTMDFNYSNVGATKYSPERITRWLRRPDGTWPHGYMTGSGQPMKFVKTDGTIVPVYQQLNRLIDYQMLAVIQEFGYEGLQLKGGVEVCKQAINASIAKDFGVVTMAFQNVYFYGGVKSWLEQCLAHASSNNLPIWNAGRWAQFTEVRQSAQFTNTTWDSANARLTFGLVATPTPGITLTVLIPLSYGGSGLKTISLNGSPPVPYAIELVNGVNIAFVNIAAGSTTVEANYELDSPLTGASAANDSPQPVKKPVVFTATVAGGSNPNFVWEFGDGTFGSGAVISHTYNEYPPGGTQVVTLTVSNGAGALVRTTNVHLLYAPQAYLPWVSKKQ